MVIDALGFARACRRLQGQQQAQRFVRLCQGLPEPQEGIIHWRVTGQYHHATGAASLDVWAEGAMTLVCQRCLDPFQQTLHVRNTLGLVPDRAGLEALDALEACGEGPDGETILADEPLDVLALVEDELILALPYAPRHDQCAERLSAKLQDESAEPSPFAVLEHLKKH